MITNIQLNLSQYTNRQDESSILFKFIQIKQWRVFRFQSGKQMRKEQTEVCRQMTVLPTTALIPNIDWIVYMGSAEQSLKVLLCLPNLPNLHSSCCQWTQVAPLYWSSTEEVHWTTLVGGLNMFPVNFLTAMHCKSYCSDLSRLPLWLFFPGQSE